MGIVFEAIQVLLTLFQERKACPHFQGLDALPLDEPEFIPFRILRNVMNSVLQLLMESLFMPHGSKLPDRWIADRMRHIESSGIRKVFELALSLKDPVT